MSSAFGRRLRVTVYGASHDREIGVYVDGLSKGDSIDRAALQHFLSRRSSANVPFSTTRSETDEPHFLSGLEDDVLTGERLHAVLFNRDVRSQDYDALRAVPRPGHADLTAWQKWNGECDMRGGGAFSGRMTAPLCVAGGIALQLLSHRGIGIGAHVASIGTVTDDPFPLFPERELLEGIAKKPLAVWNDAAGEAMLRVLREARERKDSVGGTVECVAIGVPAGLGNAMFDGIESRLSLAFFGIPGVKGVEFGAGFAAARMHGSEHNDPILSAQPHTAVTATNHCGGILGGISNGMPIVCSVAFKPTPSIGLEQISVELNSGAQTKLRITGRHDACIAPRAVAVVEAVMALVLLDCILEQEG